MLSPRCMLAGLVVQAVLVLMLTVSLWSNASPRPTATALGTMAVARGKCEKQDLQGEIVYVINTHPDTKHDMSEMCPDDRVFMCGKPGGDGCSTIPITHNGYFWTSYKLANCMRHVCSLYDNFSIVKVDEDILLNPAAMPGSQSMCDRAYRHLTLDKKKCQSDWYIDHGTPFSLPLKSFPRKGMLGPTSAELCLGYFWYLNPTDTSKLCDGIDRITHYHAEDVSFTELFYTLGITFADLTSTDVGIPSNCQAIESEYVHAAQCLDDDLSGRRKLFPRRRGQPIP